MDAPTTTEGGQVVMSKRIRAVVIIGVVIFALVLGLVGYFAWLNIANVDTLHARVDGVIVQVRAPAAGRVLALPVELGDAVAEHEELATLDTVVAGQAGVTRLAVPVRSPLAGVATDIAVQPGDAVSAGQVMLTLADPDTLWVTASVHESRIAQVRVGQRVRIQVNTRSVRRVFWGRVEQIGTITTTALADKARGTDVSTPRVAEVPIRISLDAGGYALYPGMTAQVRIGLRPR